MNKVILRFCIVKNGEVFEAVFDGRLSFLENFALLKTISSYGIDKHNRIIDIDRHITLNKDVPLSSFDFPNFMTLYLF